MESSLTYPDQLQLATLKMAGGFSSTQLGLGTGWNIRNEREVIGHGIGAFESASSALISFNVHRAAGMSVNEEGTLVQLSLGPTLNPVSVLCKSNGIPGEDLQRHSANNGQVFPGVLNTIMVYGTLPRHIESGEEAFLVYMDSEERVYSQIVAFSRHQWLVAKLCDPLARKGQDFITRRYFNALALAAEGRLS